MFSESRRKGLGLRGALQHRGDTDPPPPCHLQSLLCWPGPESQNDRAHAIQASENSSAQALPLSVQTTPGAREVFQGLAPVLTLFLSHKMRLEEAEQLMQVIRLQVTEQKRDSGLPAHQTIASVLRTIVRFYDLFLLYVHWCFS